MRIIFLCKPILHNGLYNKTGDCRAMAYHAAILGQILSIDFTFFRRRLNVLWSGTNMPELYM